MTKNRLEAFSDGVFAVAITILALDLRVPSSDEVTAHHGLWRALLFHWPTYAAYATSFVVIGIIWISHNGVFRNIKSIDRALLFFNLFLLMFVVAIPFATALVADYLNKGHAGNVAVALYSAVMLAHAATWTGLWWWVSGHPALLADHVDPVLARKARWRFGMGTPVYAGAVVVSFVSAPLTLLGHFIVAIVYSFEQLRVERPGGAAGGSAEVAAEAGELLDSE
jgi:TMEM175 potassium channel family protein